MADYVGNGGPDGTIIGRTGEPLGFFGATPVTRPSGTAQSAVATTAITALVTTPTATDIAIAVNSLITRVAALVTLGNAVRQGVVDVNLIKGSN